MCVCRVYKCTLSIYLLDGTQTQEDVSIDEARHTQGQSIIYIHSLSTYLTAQLDLPVTGGGRSAMPLGR